MKTVRLVWGYLRHNLMSAMAYRGAFLLQGFGMVLNNTMLLFFWWVLFNRLPTLRGWDLAGVMTLHGIVAFGFGAATVVCGNAFLVARVIASGDLDYYLALPADPLVHLLVSRMSKIHSLSGTPSLGKTQTFNQDIALRPRRQC